MNEKENIMQRIFSVLSLLMISSGAMAEIRTGLWEITINGKIEGMPHAMPTQVQQQCFTDENMLPKPPHSDDCVMKSDGLQGNRIEWTATCHSPQGKAVGTGFMDFNGNTMEGGTEMVMNGPHGTMKVVTTVAGKYLGKCK